MLATLAKLRINFLWKQKLYEEKTEKTFNFKITLINIYYYRTVQMYSSYSENYYLRA